MLEGKAGGLSLFIAPTKLVGDVAVSMCFPMTVNGCALSKLGACGQNCGSNCFPAGSEEACLCYALYMMVNQVLCGDPVAVSKSKVGAVGCGAHNGMFFINWKTKGTASAVRKSIGLALRVLNPAKMFPVYSRCMREIGGVPKKETFAHVAAAAAAGVKSDLVVGVVGNIKADKAKLDAMLDVLKKKHVVSAVEGSKSKPADHTPCDHSNHTEVKTNGWSSAVLSDYLRFKVRGLNPMLNDKFLLLPIKDSQWSTLAKKIKPGVKEYVAAKYTKVGDDLPEVFGYLTISSNALCACSVRTMIHSKLNASAVEAAITKSL
jgi:hypothetical protein